MCKGAACVPGGIVHAFKSWRECVRPVLCLASPSGATLRDAPVQPGGGTVEATLRALTLLASSLNASLYQ